MLTGTYTLGNKTLKIEQDTEPRNPRTDWDNLGTFGFSHRRYSFGDEKKIQEIVGSRTPEDIQKFCRRKDVISLPVFMYDHSGQTIKASKTGQNPFSCPWDSGLIGWVFVTVQTAKNELAISRMTKKNRERVLKQLEAEVEIYDMFLTGDVYGFTVTDENGKEDSCWGFFGSDIHTNGILEHIGKEWEKIFPKPETKKLVVR
jgi:hypothetical protein